MVIDLGAGRFLADDHARIISGATYFLCAKLTMALQTLEGVAHNAAIDIMLCDQSSSWKIPADGTDEAC